MQPSSTLYYVLVTICVCLIFQLVITLELWTVTNPLFPTVPVFDFIPADFLLSFQKWFYGLNLVLLISLRVFDRKEWLIWSFLLISAFMILLNVQRLQVWFYQLSIMLFLVSFYKREPQVIRALQFSIIAIYCWSGFHKLNVYYIDDIFPWFIEKTFLYGLGMNTTLAIFSALFEMAIGIGLIFKQTRLWAVGFGIFFHIMILICLGPVGHDWNLVVWPWNLAMISFLGLLFYKEKEIDFFTMKNDFQSFPLITLPILLIGILPCLNLFDQWDEQLSFKMYSGSNMEGVFYFKTEDELCFSDVPTKIATLPPHNIPLKRVLLDQWSMSRLQVPPYASRRMYRRLGKKLCKCLENPTYGGIEILMVNRWKRDSEHFENISCLELMK